jgi:hypothetical protein
MRMLTGGDTGSPGTTTKRRTEREKRTEQGPSLVEQARKTAKPDAEAVIYDELKKMLLSNKEISKLKEPIVFWSHDDTVEPGNTYRYRVRLGVFNPVAGTGQVRAEDADYDSRVILWSKYSDVTEPVHIPQRLYFFPVGVQEASKGVEVQVYKYALGYWYSAQFMVKRGDEIGKGLKTEPSSADKSKARGKEAEKTKEEEKNLTLPEMVDYTTGAIVMDVIASGVWSGDKALVQGQYYEMLYSYNGDTIERMATKQMFWPEEIRTRYAEIRALEKKPKLAFRAWSNTSVLGQQRIFRGIPTKTTSPRPGEEQMSQDEMNYMMMLQGAPQK